MDVSQSFWAPIWSLSLCWQFLRQNFPRSNSWLYLTFHHALLSRCSHSTHSQLSLYPTTMQLQTAVRSPVPTLLPSLSQPSTICSPFVSCAPTMTIIGTLHWAHCYTSGSVLQQEPTSWDSPSEVVLLVPSSRERQFSAFCWSLLLIQTKGQCCYFCTVYAWNI